MAEVSDFDVLSEYLTSIGLGSLFTLVNGEPGGWLWDQIVDGVETEEELVIRLQTTPEFEQRFPLIKFQREQNASGTPTRVWNPDELLRYEEQLTNVFRRAGLPAWFYDDPIEDVQGRLMQGLSVDAIEERITTAYEYVAGAPPEVIDKFIEYYGVSDAEGALAAYMLDPSKTIQSLNRAARTAYAGGMASRYGVDVSETMAERIGQLPMSEAGIDEGFQQVAQSKQLTTESVGETTDITQQDVVASVFDADADVATQLQRRQIQRGSISGASQGGALLTQQGVTGL